MATEKEINRVKNLLDMAADAGSPNEAMIAAKRARALMDKYDISKDDLTDNREDITESYSNFSGSKFPSWLRQLGTCCASLNDCVSMTTYDWDYFKPNRFLFGGFTADAIITSYMFDTLRETAIRLCDKSSAKGRSERNFYLLGFVDSIRTKVREIVAERKEKIKTSDGRSLVVCKKALVDEHFSKVPVNRTYKQRLPTGGELRAQLEGQIDGEKTSLDQQINTAEKPKELR